MTYATLQQLKDRFGTGLLVQLTDREEEATGEIDEAVIDRALADTDAMINGFLGAYRLPMTSVPPLLADLAQVMAIYKLHRFEPNPKIQADYKDALRMLGQIADGTVRLPIEGVEPAGNGSTGVMVTDRERPLTAANMKGFI